MMNEGIKNKGLMIKHESPGTITEKALRWFPLQDPNSTNKAYIKNHTIWKWRCCRAHAYSEVGDHEGVTPEGFQMLLPKEPRCSNEGWIGESCFCGGCTGYDTNEAPDDEGRGSAAEQGARYPLPQMEDTSEGGAHRASCELNGDSLPEQGPDQ